MLKISMLVLIACWGCADRYAICLKQKDELHDQYNAAKIVHKEAADITRNMLIFPNEDQNDIYVKAILFWKKEAIHYAFLSMKLLVDFREKSQQCDIISKNELKQEQDRIKKVKKWDRY